MYNIGSPLQVYIYFHIKQKLHQCRIRASDAIPLSEYLLE
nr:MAG TPA: hypothetical protein [Caudoviricetes sp.]